MPRISLLRSSLLLASLALSCAAPRVNPESSLSAKARDRSLRTSLSLALEHLPTEQRSRAFLLLSEDAIVAEAEALLGRATARRPPAKPSTLVTLDSLAHCRTLPAGAYFEIATEFDSNGFPCSGLQVRLACPAERGAEIIVLSELSLCPEHFEEPHLSERFEMGPSCIVMPDMQCSSDFNKWDIGFPRGSAVIPSVEFRKIGDAAGLLERCRKATLVVEPHSATNGHPADNDRLAERRSSAVQRALASFTVAPARLNVLALKDVRALRPTPNATPPSQEGFVRLYPYP